MSKPYLKELNDKFDASERFQHQVFFTMNCVPELTKKQPLNPVRPISFTRRFWSLLGYDTFKLPDYTKKE